MEIREYRDPEFPGYYVSDEGDVYSTRQNRPEGMYKLRPGTDKMGYHQVVLCNNTRRRTFKVHQLVGKTFIDNPHNHTDINHKDEIKLNNCVDNLEWCDHQYNMEYTCGKTWKVMWKSTGEVFSVFNLNKFCRTMNIYPNQLKRRGNSIIPFSLVD